MSTDADAAPATSAVREALREIVDPCTAATGSNLDVVEMGLVESIDVTGGTVRVAMHLTTPACHMVPYFITEIEDRVEPLSGAEEVTVDTDDGLTWTAEMMADSARAKRRAVLDAYDARAAREDATAE